jgi:hypothetical protein
MAGRLSNQMSSTPVSRSNSKTLSYFSLMNDWMTMARSLGAMMGGL